MAKKELKLFCFMMVLMLFSWKDLFPEERKIRVAILYSDSAQKGKEFPVNKVHDIEVLLNNSKSVQIIEREKLNELRKVSWLNRNFLEGQDFLNAKNANKNEVLRGISVQSTQLKKEEWESRVLELELNR